MSFRLDEGFGYASLQGMPVRGKRKYGVPPGGAFDLESMALANALVGNLSDKVVLELGLFAGAFTATEDHVLAAVGCECEMTAGGAKVRPQGSFTIKAGTQLRFQAPTRGCRIYLATPGGFSGPLGSRLANGTFIVAEPCKEASWNRRLDHLPHSLDAGVIHIVPGPGADWADMSKLEDRTFTVSPKSDRSGLRLAGIGRSDLGEQTSEPSCVGVIQLAPNGEILIHGPDGPTVGGYPKLAAVITADLGKLAQLKPGDEVTFELESLKQARITMERQSRKLKVLVDQIHLTKPVCSV